MNSNTIKILRSAGWSPQRNINIKEAEIYLKEKGYVIIESFCHFYKEFGNLGFNIDVNDRPRSIQLDIFIPVRYDYDSVIIEDYPRITETKYLLPIGNVNGSSNLVIDENNVIYLLNDGSVIKLGNNPSEALDNLCNVGWPELRAKGEYPIPDWW